MSSRPEISYNANGEVTMELRKNGMTIFLKFSPDVARIISGRLSACAEGAERMKEEREQIWMEPKEADVPLSGVDANEVKTGLDK